MLVSACTANPLRLRLRLPARARIVSTMKMTIFKGTEIEVEKEINKWLQSERINKIRHVTHVNYGATVYISVWWHPLDSEKRLPGVSSAHGLS